jgi:quinol monooxygenase YgiN
MFHTVVTIVARAGQREELLRALRALVNPTRVEPGCLCCRIFQDVEDDDAITLIEEWSTGADLEQRLKSDTYRQLLQLMELSSIPPQLAFHEVASTTGVERIAAARLPPPHLARVDAAKNNSRIARALAADGRFPSDTTAETV